ncbi:MAG TPA: hypothetical protein PKA05_18175, partial [Roseiflexaceae bacterium]|nr:hypothetical protein [Roseiflexaceae bacterium]
PPAKLPSSSFAELRSRRAAGRAAKSKHASRPKPGWFLHAKRAFAAGAAQDAMRAQGAEWAGGTAN